MPLSLAPPDLRRAVSADARDGRLPPDLAQRVEVVRGAGAVRYVLGGATAWRLEASAERSALHPDGLPHVVGLPGVVVKEGPRTIAAWPVTAAEVAHMGSASAFPGAAHRALSALGGALRAQGPGAGNDLTWASGAGQTDRAAGNRGQVAGAFTRLLDDARDGGWTVAEEQWGAGGRTVRIVRGGAERWLTLSPPPARLLVVERATDDPGGGG